MESITKWYGSHGPILSPAVFDYLPFSVSRIKAKGDYILASTTFFFIVYWLTGYFSKNFAVYRKLSKIKRVAWRSHLVSQVHALFVCWGSLQIMSDPAHNADPIFHYSDLAERWFAFSTGYFVWDCYVAIRNYEGFAFVYHGFMCLILNFCVFKPIYQFYGMLFLFFEFSTIFLNIHWFFDKLDMTGSSYQLINGVFLLITFFGIRLVFGSYHIFKFFQLSFQSWDKLPSGFPWFFFVAISTMQPLNFYWFFSMVTSIRKRMAPKKERVKSD